MGANVRLVLRRAHSQQTLLLAVVAVAIVGATLLGTFALLMSSSSHHLLAIALDRSPAEDRQIDVTLTLSSSEGAAGALTDGAGFLDDLLGPVPAARETWLASAMYTIQDTDDDVAPYGYLAMDPHLAANSRLVSGSFPTTGTDAAGRVQVAVPQIAADAYGWSVGSEAQLRAATSRSELTMVVTGTFAITGPPAQWTRDELGGAQHDGAYPVVGSAGFLQTQAWGPFVVGDATLFSDGTAELGVAHLVAHPELANVPASALNHLRHQLDDDQQRLAAAVADNGASSIVGTRLSQTIDAAVGSLLVTRVTLVVVALLLVTLAITVLMLAARMLADRRVAEQALMASRGASNSQILRLAALEAFAVAVIASVAAPFLAVAAYRALSVSPAIRTGGLDADPGRPPLLWITCAASAVLLASVLIAPLLRRGGTNGALPQARQDRRGAAARSGADVALVALAGVALWQLRSYQSPVGSTTAGLGGVDPVLVIAPALVLLAGAVLALRLMPLVAHVGERLAARSRSWISPLAVWELGRRPSRATAAVLLLTLAVGVGAFSSSFLSTWRASQQDQTDLLVGTDLRAVPTARTPLGASAQITAVAGAQDATPATFREATIGPPATEMGASANGIPTTLLAVDTTRADALLRGRSSPDWSTRTAPLRPAAPATGVPLPGTARYLVLNLRAIVTAPSDGLIRSSVVVQDRTGARTAISVPSVHFGDTLQDVVVPLPAAAAGAQLVGVVATAIPDPGSLPLPAGTTFALRVAKLRTVDAPASESRDVTQKVPELAAFPAGSVHRVRLGDATWNGAQSRADAKITDGVLRLRNGADIPGPVYADRIDLTAITFEDPSSGDRDPRALVTPDVLSTFEAQVGDPLELAVGDGSVRVVIAGTVPYLPGQPRGRGVLVDEDVLSRSLVAGGFVAPVVDEWWIPSTGEDASVAAALEQSGAASSRARVTERAIATDGPLHVGVQAALWIVVAAGLALAVSGLAMSAAVTVRARRLEFARLQALGAPRSGLVRSVLLEHAILGAVGVAVGVALGALLAHVVAPLITTSSAGGTPVPGVEVHWNWDHQLVLVGALVGLVAAVVALTTSTLLKRASGELLRLGDER